MFWLRKFCSHNLLPRWFSFKVFETLSWVFITCSAWQIWNCSIPFSWPDQTKLGRCSLKSCWMDCKGAGRRISYYKRHVHLSLKHHVHSWLIILRVRSRPVTLIGFSLGARVIFKCLQCLAETEGDNGNHHNPFHPIVDKYSSTIINKNNWIRFMHFYSWSGRKGCTSGSASFGWRRKLEWC